MSLINNRFLSLTNRVQAKIKAQQKEESSQKELTNNSSDAKKEETSSQNLQQVSNTKIDNNFLLTYRGININHIDTALEKATVSETQTGLKSQNEKPAMPTVDKSVISNSSIASDYKNSTTRTGALGIKNSSKLSAIKNLASSDLNSVAEAIKAQLKKTLGSNYDAKSVQESINEAIEKTLKTFEQNAKTRRSGGYNVDDSENAFVYKKKSIFGSVGKYMYNVEALANTFLESYNTIASSKFEKAINDVQNSVNNVKNELLQKKDEIAAQYALSSNFMTFVSNFDDIYKEALDSINQDNYKDADKFLIERLNENFVTIKGNDTNELKDRLDKLFSSTSKNYKDMYCSSISDDEFIELFDSAKEQILSSVNGTSCDLKSISNSFDTAILKAVNIATSTNAVAKTNSAISTRSVESTPEYDNKPTKVKGSNGYTISYEPNTNDKANTGTISITGKDNVSYKLNLNMTNGLGKTQLLEMLKDLKPEILQDLIKEADTIDIVNLVPGDQINSSTRAAADGMNGKIYFVFDLGGFYHNGETINSFSEKIIAHEVGHLIDSVNNNNSAQSDSSNEMFWELLKLLPGKGRGVYSKAFKDQYYGFKNINEFFAEYYAYKTCGDTDNKFKELINELKSCKKINELKEKNGIDKKTIKNEAKQIKDIIEKLITKFDETIEETRKLPDVQRNDNKKEEVNAPSKLPNVQVPSENYNPIIDNQSQQPLTPSEPIKPIEPNTPNHTTAPDEPQKPTVNEIPTPPAPNTPTNPSSNQNNMEIINGSIENAGAQAGIMPEITHNGIENNNFSSSYTKEQLNQIHDYVENKLKDQYGDDYQIDVKVDANGNASYHIMSKLDGTPNGGTITDQVINGQGSTTGYGADTETGSSSNESNNSTQANQGNYRPAQDTASDNDYGSGGGTAPVYINGTNINIEDIKYQNPDGTLNMYVLIKDLAAQGQAYTTSDPKEIKEFLSWVQNKYGNVTATEYGSSISSTWDKYWSELGFGYAGSVDMGTNEEHWGSSTGNPSDNDYYNSITAGYGEAQRLAQELENIKNQQAPPSTAGYTNGYESGSTDGYSNGYSDGSGYDGNYNYTHKGTAGYSNGYYNGY